MTHAALKDLVKKWREEAAEARASGVRAQKRGNQDYAEVLWQAGNDAEAYADELSAALSAMEGAAVDFASLIVAAENYASTYDGDDRQDIKTDVLNAFYAGSTYTAPPPQQADTVDRYLALTMRQLADQEDDQVTSQMDFIWRGFTQDQRDEANRVVSAAINEASTHPTPSPGSKPTNERSTHHVHRGPESLPCYCAATMDHTIGQEVSPGPQGGGEAFTMESLPVNAPKQHSERKDAEEAYTLTAFNYEANPVGCRDWTIYWRGWWHRAVIYKAATPPAHQPGEVLDAEAIFDIAVDAWNKHQSECRITTTSGSIRKVCEAITAALAPKEAGHDR